jgi:protease-4
VQLRVSGDKYPAVSTPKKIALFDLDDLLADRVNPTLSLLGVGQDDPYLRLTQLLDGAIRDPDLKGVILKVNPLGGGLGKAMELRDAIARLRNAGKEVVAMVLQASDAEYLAIAGCTRIVAVPGAMFLVDGFSASPIFAGAAFDKLGVSWDVARVGAYKNAPDLFTKAEMSAEQKEVINAYLDLDVAQFEQAVARGRGLSAEKVRAAVAEGIKSPRRALELGLIDEVLGPAELEEKLPQLFPGARFDPYYRPRSTRDPRWGGRPKIAVVPVLGDIAGGRSREDPIGLQRTAGAETFIRAIQQAEADPEVVAIVVRVDSGGGDGLASDLMYRAVAQARKKKPVVASMGDVAASGGYYVAMGAEEIFAQPTTLTGSIGVFFLKPALKGLAERFGVNQQTVKRGELSGLLNMYEPWGPGEKAAAQKWVDSFYDDFITEVARSRKMDKAKVDEVARGRVWSGQDAERVGLVDQMGGLLEAIDWARARAGLKPSEEVEISLVGEPKGLLAAAAGEEGVLARLLPAAPAPAFPPGLLNLARSLGLEAALELRPQLLAKQEFRLEVQ